MKEWANKVVIRYGKRNVILGLAIITFLILAFGYNDVIIINRESLSLWKSISLYHNPFHFYDVSYQDTVIDKLNGKLAVVALYDFTMFVVEGLWDLPLYVASLFTTTDIAVSWYGILWGKMLHVLFLFADAYLVFLLAQKGMEEDEAIDASVYFLTSIITCSSVYLIGQCDSIVISFALLGMNRMLEKRYVNAIVFFSIAASMKIFALFLFVALLLLLEKRIIRIGLYTAPVLAFVALVKLIFRPLEAESIAERSGFLVNQTTQMFTSRLPIMTGWISVFSFLIIAMLCICYCIKKPTFEQIILVSFLMYFAVFLSFDQTPYWLLYMVPFFSILLARAERYNADAYIFALMGEAGLVAGHFLKYYWCYDVLNVNRSLIGNIIPGMASTESGFFRFATFSSMTNWIVFGSFYALFVVCFIIVVIFYVKNMIKPIAVDTVDYSENQWLYNGRILLRLLFAMIPFVVYILNRIEFII